MERISTLSEHQAKFVYYSVRERMAFQELAKHMGYLTHMVSDESGFERYDVIYSDPKTNTRHIADLKVRKHNSTEFNGKWILEKGKYDHLMNSIEGRIVEHIKLKSTYIIFFWDKIAIFNLDKVDPNSFKTERLLAASVGGIQTNTDKEVTYLDIKDAQVINYQLDYDKLSFNAKTVFKYNYPNNAKHIINI